jgi:tetratricopeptide (TPR) repeat protein
MALREAPAPAAKHAVTPGIEPPAEIADQTARIRREIIQLAVLTVIAIGTFLVTRAVASANRRTSLRDAAAWYERGQRQMAAGALDDAIESLHHATVRNREDQGYALALARALAAKGQDGSARRVLLALRESAPDATEVNVELARLAASRQDSTEAVRYYHNALYAPWASERAPARRQLRVELVRFLLGHGQASRALSELLALSADLPEQAPAHVEVGQLFAQAGDPRHALDHFQRALRLAPDDGPALAGAGEAAFRLGDYARARTYLAAAPVAMDEVAATREIVEAVLSRDPLASRLRSAERARRLRANLGYVEGRFAACLATGALAPPAPGDGTLREEARSVDAELTRSAGRDRDTIEAGAELVDRMVGRAVEACPPATPLDQALLLIGRMHGPAER